MNFGSVFNQLYFCTFSLKIKYKFIIKLMERGLRTHRRNKAVESLDKNMHQSFNFNIGKLSFGHDYNGPLTLRLSDLSSTHTQIYSSSPSSHLTHSQIISPTIDKKKDRTSKILSNLKTNLLQLQEKLVMARCQLQISGNKSIRPKFNSPKQNMIDLFICPQLQEDESTINLESHKKLLSIKSKERLDNSPKIKQYYIGNMIKAITGKSPLAMEHLQKSMKIMKQSISVEIPSIFQIQQKKLFLAKNPIYEGKKTIFIQLNQTLLHLRQKQLNPQDIKIGSSLNSNTYISLRPYTMSFLKKISTMFEIIVFTDLQKKTVDDILDEIDHQKKLISHRIYRQQCYIIKKDKLVKDLRGINRNLKDSVIIDSRPQSYMLQPDNAVPILPYRGNNDRQLMDLERYLLKEVSCVGDVREANRDNFKLSNYWQHDNQVYLVKDLYLNEDTYY